MYCAFRARFSGKCYTICTYSGIFCFSALKMSKVFVGPQKEYVRKESALLKKTPLRQEPSKKSQSIYFVKLFSYLNLSQFVYCVFRPSFSGKCYIFCTCSDFFFFCCSTQNAKSFLWVHRKKMYGKSQLFLKKRPWDRNQEKKVKVYTSWNFFPT